MTREEAIEVVKEKLDYYEREKRLKAACEVLIPELAESEDEKIRMELIEFIQWSEDRGMTRHDYHQAKRPAVWIAYLEKQKEQKPKWSEEDDMLMDELESYILYDKEFNDEQKSWRIKRLKSLRPQPKQNDMITPNKEFFQWIYDRLVNVHNEDPNVDYMISFKRRIEELSFDKPSWKPSEEQMDSLERAIILLEKQGHFVEVDILKSIQRNLKKLQNQ